MVRFYLDHFRTELYELPSFRNTQLCVTAECHRAASRSYHQVMMNGSLRHGRFVIFKLSQRGQCFSTRVPQREFMYTPKHEYEK
jgi:hypothetical protein